MTSKQARRKRALEIIYKLKMAGSSQADIARRHKVSSTAVWNTIWTDMGSRAIKETIASIVGGSVGDLWPEDDEEERAA